MSGLSSVFVVVGGVVMGLIVLRWIVEAIRRGAVAEERARESQRQAEIAAKRAQEMLKERTVEDIVRDLDAGEF